MITSRQIPKRYRNVSSYGAAYEKLKSRRVATILYNSLGSITQKIPVRIVGIWNTEDLGRIVAIKH